MSGPQLSDFELYVFPGECLFVKIAQASARALGQELSLRNNNGTAALELVPADHLQLHHEATHCNLDGSRLERQPESWESEPLCSAVEPRTARLGFYSILKVRLELPPSVLELFRKQCLEAQPKVASAFDLGSSIGRPRALGLLVVADGVPLTSFEVSHTTEVMPRAWSESMTALAALRTIENHLREQLGREPARLKALLLQAAAVCGALQVDQPVGSSLSEPLTRTINQLDRLAAEAGRKRLVVLPRSSLSQAEFDEFYKVITSLKTEFETLTTRLGKARVKVQQFEPPPQDLESPLVALETSLGLSLPSDYREFLKQGADHDPGWLEQLFELEELANHPPGELIEHGLAVGSDGLGNYVVLMLAGSECGSVFFWNHEGAQATRLAESFTEFLPLLEGPEPQ